MKMRVVDYLTDALCRAGGEGLKALAEHTR